MPLLVKVVLTLLKQTQGQQTPEMEQLTELALNLGVQILSFDPRLPPPLHRT